MIFLILLRLDPSEKQPEASGHLRSALGSDGIVYPLSNDERQGIRLGVWFEY